MSPKRFEFIVADKSGRANSADRALIRSHCMRGKNKRDGSRRSLRQQRTAAAGEQTDGQPIVTMPPRAPSETELVPFEAKVSEESRRIFFRTFCCSPSNFAFSPLESCIDFGLAEMNAFELSLGDSAFLHALLLVSSALGDYALDKKELGSTARSYLRETLNSLNDMLSSGNAHRRTSVIYIVMSLALLAALFDDRDAATAHISGMSQIIQLRGGHRYLHRIPKLHFKIDRLDLSWSLVTGQHARFVPSTLDWSPVFPLPGRLPSNIIDLSAIDNTMDTRLVTAYQDLNYLSVLISHHINTSSLWDGATFQTALSSIQYRLLKLEKELEDDLAQCFCLAMLAYIAVSFRIPRRETVFQYLAEKLRSTIEAFDDLPLGPERVRLESWILIVGSVTTLKSSDKWVVKRWETVSPYLHADWDKARLEFKKVMWINSAHDKSAKVVFEHLMTQVGKS
ncbi:hypothetical protein BS50DRAFT_676703 [Corynespora cassiicola Philippines]|uniref:Transcription factor domain-containing protein n=1 Tax=Corynespora cassiicola Philippines TaxID=1448308 RepID=A0A2T2NNP5_CORCC|nr:hypothetical protein BS50DRAFT_676703 [Corynespora cassiicola Philippines]